MKLASLLVTAALLFAGGLGAQTPNTSQRKLGVTQSQAQTQTQTEPQTQSQTNTQSQSQTQSQGQTQAQSQTQSTQQQVKRCQAKTQAGTQCKRKAEPNSKFCWQHGGRQGKHTTTTQQKQSN